MKYEWDENKRKINLQKHSLDFIDADLVYESPGKITVVVTREEDDEERWADFADVKGHVLKFVYTLRGDSLRCISLRKASKKERALYHEAREMGQICH